MASRVVVQVVAVILLLVRVHHSYKSGMKQN